MVVTVTIPAGEPGNNVGRKEGSKGDGEKSHKLWNKYLQILSEQWLVFCFGIATLLAWRWPSVAATGGPIKSEYTILYGSVAIIFLISGLQLSTQKLRANLFNWRLHLIVQGISFIIIPVIWLAIMWIIIAAGDLHTQAIETSILIGMLVTSCLPTTIASNIVMTRNAGGDDAAAIIEVVIGNVFGSFISPGLIYVLIPNRPEFVQWAPAQPSDLGKMYGNVAQQLGLAVILPLAVGQGVRILFKEQVIWCVEKLYLGKISSVFLGTLVWTTFSNAFKTGAIYTMPKGSILFNIFMNIALYVLFTVICFVLARPPHGLAKVSGFATRLLPRCVQQLIIPRRMSKEQAVAVCFCGAAKTSGVGIPLVAAMWAKQSDITRAYIAIPVLLYTMEQVFMAQILVYIFKGYLRRDVHSELDVESRRGGICDLDGSNERTEAETGEEDAGQQKSRDLNVSKDTKGVKRI